MTDVPLDPTATAAALTAASAEIERLRHAIEGARDSFREIEAMARDGWGRMATRVPEYFGSKPCACEPGTMCGMCIAREAAAAMESALRGDTIPTADNPEDVALARAAFRSLLDNEEK